MKKVNWQKATKFSVPEQSPGFLLWHVSTRWRKAVEQALKLFELTHPQFVVLAALAWLEKEEKAVSQKELAHFTNIDTATTSQIVRLLQKKKLVTRKHLPGDERAKFVNLTKRGAEIVEKAIPHVEEVDAQFFKSVTTRGNSFVQQLLRLLG